MLSYSNTPVQEIHDRLLDQAGVRLLIKREDLNHPFVSGNKWWKLKYNLKEAIKTGHQTLLTFGGAYSNHIYATAAAAYELGLKSIGVIRGEETLPLNNTISFAKSKGMSLHHVSRESYQLKTDKGFIEALQKTFGDFYLIPEGGTNALAVKGVTEFAQTLGNDFDYLCCAVGTGGTMAGLICGSAPGNNVIGFPVLKGGDFLREEIKSLLPDKVQNWELVTDYHFGGYAKVTAELTEFVGSFEQKHNIKLDPVYTGKMFYGIIDLIKKNLIPKGSTILAIHTGGLQK
ncbi:MAG TPA: pyridoxal-phosphate dependent enzyme [Cyclobacteriaceae bacterium]|nr:pyridoxal-phosphate dependent enzyme [Cyclobacteriaceae bacterium]